MSLLDGIVSVTGCRSGHFRMSGGRHTTHWIDPWALYHDPGLVYGVCEEISSQFLGNGMRAEVVVSPNTTGQASLALITSHLLSQKMEERVVPVYAERVRQKWYKPYSFAPEIMMEDSYVIPVPECRELIDGKRVLVILDILVDFKHLKSLMDEVRECGGMISAVAIVADFGQLSVLEAEREEGVPAIVLSASTAPKVWEPGECTVCNHGG